MRLLRFLCAGAALAIWSTAVQADDTRTITFDEVDAGGSYLRAKNPTRSDDPVTAYLTDNGLEVVDQQPTTRDLYVVIASQTENGAFIAPSYPNVFQQMGSNGPISYTMRFKKPLAKFSFKRARLLAGPTGITHPTWSAAAIDGSGRGGQSVGEGMISSYSTVPERTFTLVAPAGGVISSVKIEADNASFAAFSSVVLDDFVLTYAKARTP